MRRLRHELTMLAIVLTVPLLLALMFPFEAVDFKPSAPVSAKKPVCAFVSVDAAGQAKIFAAAKSAWRLGRGSAGQEAAFSLGELPDMPSAAALRAAGISAAIRGPEYRDDFLPPSAGAPAPQKLAPSGETPQVAFSREEMLEMD